MCTFGWFDFVVGYFGCVLALVCVCLAWLTWFLVFMFCVLLPCGFWYSFVFRGLCFPFVFVCPVDFAVCWFGV